MSAYSMYIYGVFSLLIGGVAAALIGAVSLFTGAGAWAAYVVIAGLLAVFIAVLAR
jgi:hypothetical protein